MLAVAASGGCSGLLGVSIESMKLIDDETVKQLPTAISDAAHWLTNRKILVAAGYGDDTYDKFMAGQAPKPEYRSR